MRFILLLFLIFTQSILLHNPIHIQAACSSCLISSVVGGPGLNIRGKSGHHRHRHHHHHHHYHHHHHHAVVVPHDTILKRRLLHRNHHHHHHHLNLSSTTKSVFMYIAIKQLSTHFGYNVMKNTNSSSREDDNNVHSKNTQEKKEKQGKEDDNEQSSKSSSTQSNNNNNNNVSAGMVGAIGIYKNFISPLLPPACRFLPTCSQYGVQAIEEFGPTKGSILTAWRLLRCSPFGGRGYDPPIWPPVSYTYGSY